MLSDCRETSRHAAVHAMSHWFNKGYLLDVFLRLANSATQHGSSCCTTSLYRHNDIAIVVSTLLGKKASDIVKWPMKLSNT